jgi:hypothetical protein
MIFELYLGAIRTQVKWRDDKEPDIPIVARRNWCCSYRTVPNAADTPGCPVRPPFLTIRKKGGRLRTNSIQSARVGCRVENMVAHGDEAKELRELCLSLAVQTGAKDAISIITLAEDLMAYIETGRTGSALLGERKHLEIHNGPLKPDEMTAENDG